MSHEYHPKGSMGAGAGVLAVGCNASRSDLTDEEKKCLEERKYWCFLLSSIVTFCLSMLLVVSWRIIAHLCCRPKESEQFEEVPVDEDLAKNGKFNGLGPGKDHEKYEDGPPGQQQEEAHIGWMTEAKDWAGELISGQSTTGRILVRKLYHPSFELSIAEKLIRPSFSNARIINCAAIRRGN